MKKMSVLKKSLMFLTSTLALASTGQDYQASDLAGHTIICKHVTQVPYSFVAPQVYKFLGLFEGHNLVQVSSDFGYGPENAQLRTYTVSQEGDVAVQVDGLSNKPSLDYNIHIIFDEKTLSLKEFTKNGGVIKREMKNTFIDEEGIEVTETSIQSCELK